MAVLTPQETTAALNEFVSEDHIRLPLGLCGTMKKRL